MQNLLMKPIFALLLLVGILINVAVSKPQGHISLVRRDGPDDINNLLSEFRAKGSRMRFGKRTPKDFLGFDGEYAEPIYAPDRFLWLQ